MVNRVVPDESLMDQAIALARDILTTDPTTRAEIKRIMDAGWRETLDRGLAIEAAASHQHMRAAVTAEAVAQRREDIQARGRDQSDPDRNQSAERSSSPRPSTSSFSVSAPKARCRVFTPASKRQHALADHGFVTEQIRLQHHLGGHALCGFITTTVYPERLNRARVLFPAASLESVVVEVGLREPIAPSVNARFRLSGSARASGSRRQACRQPGYRYQRDFARPAPRPDGDAKGARLRLPG